MELVYTRKEEVWVLALRARHPLQRTRRPLVNPYVSTTFTTIYMARTDSKLEAMLRVRSILSVCHISTPNISPTQLAHTFPPFNSLHIHLFPTHQPTSFSVIRKLHVHLSNRPVLSRPRRLHRLSILLISIAFHVLSPTLLSSGDFWRNISNLTGQTGWIIHVPCFMSWRLLLEYLHYQYS